MGHSPKTKVAVKQNIWIHTQTVTPLSNIKNKKMRKTVAFVAMIMIGLNFISCSPESIAEEDALLIIATEGDDGSDHEDRGNG